ncbi:type II toxin-antitoxin system VapC family toxin [Spirochaeta africana]|uniref:Ribonuclease VapC n=1 Tax=Spirochaeta africana (strain ATCC 700263 / DSM 8902 / Z-7692) TaxID=889378 RepID=H9UGA2_SPIAZ|nr:PIN domain-containing protein [Spirochaeta africana]AFG36545.1 putative nucleic acid-binding protein, contains PIN domain [Spirochaeta africana DSM 8902]
MYLIDTSAWIAHFSSSYPFRLSDICSPDEHYICLPVYQEILQGIRDDAQFTRIQHILDASQWVGSPLKHTTFQSAAQLYRTARRQGLTVRSSTDCLIAALGLEHNLTILHHDRDYEQLAGISLLQQRCIMLHHQ